MSSVLSLMYRPQGFVPVVMVALLTVAVKQAQSAVDPRLFATPEQLDEFVSLLNTDDPIDFTVLSSLDRADIATTRTVTKLRGLVLALAHHVPDAVLDDDVMRSMAFVWNSWVQRVEDDPYAVQIQAALDVAAWTLRTSLFQHGLDKEQRKAEAIVVAWAVDALRRLTHMQSTPALCIVAINIAIARPPESESPLTPADIAQITEELPMTSLRFTGEGRFYQQFHVQVQVYARAMRLKGRHLTRLGKAAASKLLAQIPDMAPLMFLVSTLYRVPFHCREQRSVGLERRLRVIRRVPVPDDVDNVLALSYLLQRHADAAVYIAAHGQEMFKFRSASCALNLVAFLQTIVTEALDALPSSPNVPPSCDAEQILQEWFTRAHVRIRVEKLPEPLLILRDRYQPSRFAPFKLPCRLEDFVAHLQCLCPDQVRERCEKSVTLPLVEPNSLVARPLLHL